MLKVKMVLLFQSMEKMASIGPAGKDGGKPTYD